MALRNPGNLPQGNGANSIRLQLQKPGRCGHGGFTDLRPQTPAEVFPYAARVSSLQGMQDHLPAGGAVRLRAMLRSPGGRLRSRETVIRTRCAPDPGRPALVVALHRLPAGAGATAGNAAGGMDPAAARRSPRRAARAARGLDQERRRQPDPLVQGPGRLGRAGSGPRARLPDDRVRLDREPGQRGGGPRRGRRARVLRVHTARPRRAEGPRHRRIRHQPGLRCAAPTTMSTACAPSSQASIPGRS